MKVGLSLSTVVSVAPQLPLSLSTFGIFYLCRYDSESLTSYTDIIIQTMGNLFSGFPLSVSATLGKQYQVCAILLP